jgi:hypothetical protein
MKSIKNIQIYCNLTEEQLPDKFEIDVGEILRGAIMLARIFLPTSNHHGFMGCILGLLTTDPICLL